MVFSYAVTMLWILTVTNAFNFMDNMNGLCAGLGAGGALVRRDRGCLGPIPCGSAGLDDAGGAGGLFAAQLPESGQFSFSGTAGASWWDT